jgi:hypothetical protein
LAANLATTATTTFSALTTAEQAEQNLFAQVYKLNIKNTSLLTKNHFINPPLLYPHFLLFLCPIVAPFTPMSSFLPFFAKMSFSEARSS